MKTNKITINSGPLGTGTIHLDDTDISNAVRGIDVRLRPGDFPEVTLELGVTEIYRLSAEEPDVLIDGHVRDVLIKLGWTPPQGD